MNKSRKSVFCSIVIAAGLMLFSTNALAVCPLGSVPAFPGSDTCILDPFAIPKYVTPLVIPPVINDTVPANAVQDPYAIAVRQFKQQILPGGIWNTINGRADVYPATTVWSYGPAADPAPDSTALGGGPGVAPAPNSQFNYPSYTFETIDSVPVSVRWINDLMDPVTNACLPHLLPVDQTLHWANPTAGPGNTDSHGTDPNPYMGPVPIVTHVHGAHVDPHSDGYPEAWWLPACDLTPWPGIATSGSFFDDASNAVPGTNPGNLGYADYLYRNDQPATTLWYHDHSLGMTRSNVYAGPAGFWLIRGGVNDTAAGVLPGPAPKAGDTVLDLNAPKSVVATSIRNTIREIPVAIQDRSFDLNGQLFYQGDRAFFEALNPAGGTAPTLQIPFAPNSDIAPIWNPEAFFTTMVVNGVTWPSLEVAPALYRLRLLNGCNSRFLNLALIELKKDKKKPGKFSTGRELPFYQIGAEQGFLPQVVRVETGYATPLVPGTIIMSAAQLMKAPAKQQALLMGLAERADVIVDFRGLATGDIVRMINTAPDAPFGGFPDIPADPATTGQVMQFVVNAALAGNTVAPGPLGASPTDPVDALGNPNPNAAVSPWLLDLSTVAEAPGAAATVTRLVSLNEEMSMEVCVTIAPDGSIVHIPGVLPGPNFMSDCTLAGGVPFAPKAALLGTVQCVNAVTGLPAAPPNVPPCPAGEIPAGVPLMWTDMSGVSQPASVAMADGSLRQVNVTENPVIAGGVAPTEQWDIYNFTIDGHPIHLHLVRFEVVGRTLLDGVTPSPNGIQPWETGYKDTVIAYPGEVTKVKATFDIAGLYVWHCHIVEHEDNEMMRPYVVSSTP